MKCSPHNKPENYREETKGGKVRIFCKICGRFVGYKFVEASKESKGKKAKK